MQTTGIMQGQFEHSVWSRVFIRDTDRSQSSLAHRSLTFAAVAWTSLALGVIISGALIGHVAAADISPREYAGLAVLGLFMALGLVAGAAGITCALRCTGSSRGHLSQGMRAKDRRRADYGLWISVFYVAPVSFVVVLLIILLLVSLL